MFVLLRITLLFALVFMLLFAVLPAMAQDATPEPAATAVVDNDTGEVVPPAFDLNKIVVVVGTIVTLFQTLIVSGSVGGLSAAITNVAKTFGWVQDGKALNVMPVIGVVLLGVVAGVVLLNPEQANAASLEGVVTLVSSFIGAGVALVVAVIGLFGGAKLFHNTAKGVPLVGKSYSK